jgi:chemotaxis signal transduction protein
VTLPRRSLRPPPAPLSTYVVFGAAGRRFALSTRQVVAVAEVEALNPVPIAGRREILGLVAHRGRALALFDLGRCLGGAGGIGGADGADGAAAGAAAAAGGHCLVVAQGERQAAIAVSALEGLARVSGDGLPPGCETFEPAVVIFAAGRGEAA